LPIRRTWSASGVRRIRPTSACASALGPATALSGTTGRTRHRRSDRVHGFGGSTPQVASLHTQAMIDRTPLLRFLSPSALACHVALLPGAATRTGDPASTVDRLSHATSFALMPVRHRVSPTQRRRPVCPCGLTRCTEVARSTLRGSTPHVLIETLRRSARRCIGRASAAGHAPATFCGRRSATRAAVHVAWSGPFRRREALVFSVP